MNNTLFRYVGILLFITCAFLTVGAQKFPSVNLHAAALYPQQNEYRNLMNISGVWNFEKDENDVGEKESWFNGLKNSEPIAVPGSWNEQKEGIRDYMGVVWYEQNTFIPKNWKGQRIFIRFGSVQYAAKVWLNGVPVGIHEGGSLPFAIDLTDQIKWDGENRISVRAENLLKPTRIPVGGLPPGGMFSNFPASNYDFFPYGGIQRPVWLFSVPKAAINDIVVKTNINSTNGIVAIRILKTGQAKGVKISLSGGQTGFEKNVNFSGDTAAVKIDVPNARFWSTDDPFLYRLDVALMDGKKVIDQYQLPVGIRTVSVDDNHILLNGKPVQLKGFGKHEDFPILGKGTSYPVIVKDFSLLKWIGANSFRTSHYPYDEEYYRMADREGILIIDEIPNVGLIFDDGTENVAIRLQTVIRDIRELVNRDKNHPSVIMWSLANEPIASRKGFTLGGKAKADDVSLNFFKKIFEVVKAGDDTRPATIVGVQGGPDEWLGLGDVVCINRYYGWYSQVGNIEEGAKLLSKELDELHDKFHKPIIVTEFGADAYPGMHAVQPEMFTEEYQMDLIKAYLDVADTKPFVAGMHVWAFADFKTAQGVIRFGGMNWKGVFTRDRKPKMAAHYLRSVWNKNN